MIMHYTGNMNWFVMSRHPDPHSRPNFWDICTFLLEFEDVSSKADYALEGDDDVSSQAGYALEGDDDEVYDDIVNIYSRL